MSAHSGAYWDWDEIEEEPDADSGIKRGRTDEEYIESHPSKADRRIR